MLLDLVDPGELEATITDAYRCTPSATARRELVARPSLTDAWRRFVETAAFRPERLLAWPEGTRSGGGAT